MTRLGRSLLVAEVAVCFAWVAAGLLFGIITVVVELLVNLVRFGFPGNRDYWFCALLVGGFIGMVGVLNVLRWLLDERAFLPPRAGALALVAGVATAAALLARMLTSSDLRLSTLVVLTIAAAAHLAYLARNYFLGHGRDAPHAGGTRAGDLPQNRSRKRERLSIKAAVGAVFLACAISDLFPLFGPPAFRYTGADPGNPVWNLGWPMPLFIYDPQNGIHVSPVTPLILTAQLVVIAIVLIACLLPLRRRSAAVAR